MHAAAFWGSYRATEEAREIAPTQSFNLLRWFSLISLAIIASVGLAIGSISTHFLVSESLERDAMLSDKALLQN